MSAAAPAPAPCLPALGAEQQKRLRLFEDGIRVLAALVAAPLYELQARGLVRDVFDHRHLVGDPLTWFLATRDDAATALWTLIEARHAAAEAALADDPTPASATTRSPP